MLTSLIEITGAICLASMIYAYRNSKDPFHPAVLVGCFLFFLYSWLPSKLIINGDISRFLNDNDLIFAADLDLLGILCFFLGCLISAAPRQRNIPWQGVSVYRAKVLRGAGIGCGVIGLPFYAMTIRNVGGLSGAYGQSYGGGWDDNGYYRDAEMLCLSAVVLLLFASSRKGLTYLDGFLVLSFTAPTLLQGLLGARRGPTFITVVFVAASWYLSRGKRPSLKLTLAGIGALGLIMLFLVTNRNNIFIGSDRELTTNVFEGSEEVGEGNDFIYGAGAIVSAEATHWHFWGRRYLAQILVRPIPRAVWPNKYADFGVPELEENAGTLSSMKEVVGWGSAGAAPGMVADLWIEFRWLCLPAMALIGWSYQFVWRRSVTHGGVWSAQYAVLCALSIYLVMQTMEAVIFRFLIYSVPLWLAWSWSKNQTKKATGRLQPSQQTRQTPTSSETHEESWSQ